MNPDRSLFDWLGHYLSLIVLASLVGIVVAAASLPLTSRPSEAWSVIVQSADRIFSRELGPLAQSVFATEDVYGPAMAEVGIEMPPERFLAEHAELRPVLDTRALIVVGRSQDPEEAERISDAMMRSLVRTFETRGLTEFTVFDQAAPMQPRVGPPVVLLFGGMMGFWVGVAGALIHFRLRRPILSLARAVAMSDPGHVAVVRARRPRWLGVLRRPRGWKDDEGNRAALRRLASRLPAGSTPIVTMATPQPDGSAHGLERALSGDAGEGGSRDVLVLDAGTRQETLAEHRQGLSESETGGRDLVWVS